MENVERYKRDLRDLQQQLADTQAALRQANATLEALKAEPPKVIERVVKVPGPERIVERVVERVVKVKDTAKSDALEKAAAKASRLEKEAATARAEAEDAKAKLASMKAARAEALKESQRLTALLADLRGHGC